MPDETDSHDDADHTFDYPAAVAPTAPVAPPGYELLEVVGRGGMGVVYRARDLALDREVAVKLLLDRYAPGSPVAARFLDEARITAQLQHPGIPAVYQVGTLPGGRPFLAMKLIKGQTLDALLKAKAPMDALAVFGAVSQAVGYAHAHGVIHRDLKPANVMVGAFGEVQVMDWGLAKVLARREPPRPEGDPEATLGTATEIRTPRDSDTPFTQHGSVLGTPAYMPPEQAAGELDKIDARSDVFGLGGLLCILLTGQPPFVGHDAESVRRAAFRGKTEDAFARLDASSADPGVVALCKRCLAFEPADRPATADAVAQEVAELRHAADERAKQAERDKHATEVRAAERRKRVRVAGVLAALVFVAVLAGGSVALVQWRRADTALTQVREQEHATADALAALQVEETKAQRALAQVTSEQVRTAEALAAAERAADATREGLVSWLRHSSSMSITDGINENMRDQQIVDSKTLLKKLIGESLCSAKPSRDQKILEAECHKMLGDVMLEHFQPVLDASSEYEKAIRQTYELLAENPKSVPLRRQLAACLYKICKTYRYTSGSYYNNLAPDESAAAILGGMWYVFPIAKADAISHETITRSIREAIKVMLSFQESFSVYDRVQLAQCYGIYFNCIAPSYIDFNGISGSTRYRVDGSSVPVCIEILQLELEIYKSLSEAYISDNSLGTFDRNAYQGRLVACLIKKASFHLDQLSDPTGAHLILDDAMVAASAHGYSGHAIDSYYILSGRCAIFYAQKNHSEYNTSATNRYEYIIKHNGFQTVADNRNLYYAQEFALSMADCSLLVAHDTTLKPSERDEIGSRYAAAAVGMLMNNKNIDKISTLVRYSSFGSLYYHVVFRQYVARLPLTENMLSDRSVVQVHYDPAGAVSSVELLCKNIVWTGSNSFDIARTYSLASDKLPDRREEYAVRAVELLTKAVELGWNTADHRTFVEEELDFRHLRGRTDYKKLISTLPLHLAPPPREVK